MQMKFCNAEYCDFVVWSKKSWINERIYANSDFINNAIAKTVDFIKLGILPELVGRWYTKQSLQSDEPSFIRSSSTQSSSTLPSALHPLSHHPLSHHTPSHHPPSHLLLCHHPPSCHPPSYYCHHPLSQNLVSNHVANRCRMNWMNNPGLFRITQMKLLVHGDSWCYCRKSESIDHMIGCDNAACALFNGFIFVMLTSNFRTGTKR